MRRGGHVYNTSCEQECVSRVCGKENKQTKSLALSKQPGRVLLLQRWVMQLRSVLSHAIAYKAKEIGRYVYVVSLNKDHITFYPQHLCRSFRMFSMSLK